MDQLKRILHIDDDAVMRMMVQKSIERSNIGVEIICCSSALEFINHIYVFKPDLLLIDVVMPVLDGPSLLGKMRGLQNMTPAIFMTGHEHLEFEDREKLNPIIGIIHKPFPPMELGNNLLKMWESAVVR